jgi:hypothetical protein
MELEVMGVRDGFDPLRDVPENNAEVRAALSYGRSRLLVKALIEIYEKRLGKGSPMLEAYRVALLASRVLNPRGGDNETR